VKKYLLDSNVISELGKERPNINLSTWFNANRKSELYLSVITLGEIEKGLVIKKRRGGNLSKLEPWYKNTVAEFGPKILEVDRKVVSEWGKMMADGDRNQVDSLIAATAKAYDLILATRNVKHIKSRNIKFENPFEFPELKNGKSN
jgi:predicted nucleic acid-binding protein